MSFITFTEESAVIVFLLSQVALNNETSTSGAAKFLPLNVAVSCVPFAAVPAFGIVNEVNFGTPYICSVLSYEITLPSHIALRVYTPSSCGTGTFTLNVS